jgi:hypothetical protein
MPQYKADLFDQMLRHNCTNPADIPWKPGVKMYRFEGHCSEYTVYAVYDEVADTHEVLQMRTVA